MSTIRARLDLTQEQLAGRLGVSFASVNRWEGAFNFERAERDYPGAGEMDAEALEEVVYRRFLDPQARTTFLEAFKDLEALWEIVSPDAALRDHVATFRRLAQWYAAVRNEYADRIGFVADLAHKTRRLVQESADQEGFGRLTAGITCDTGTVQTLREAPGSYEAKVFNLVRGLRQEIDTSPGTAPVLRPIMERAERVLTELETRRTGGDDALDQIEKLVRRERGGAAALARCALQAGAGTAQERARGGGQAHLGAAVKPR